MLYGQELEPLRGNDRSAFYKESKSFLKLFLITVIITCTMGLKFLS